MSYEWESNEKVKKKFNPPANYHSFITVVKSQNILNILPDQSTAD